MKTPIWESSPGALQTLLATGVFVKCELYTITLANGLGTLQYSSADQPVIINGVTWGTNGPTIAKPTTHPSWKVGLDVDSWTMDMAPHIDDGVNTPDLINGQPWLAALSAGILDGAVVEIDRAYFADWATYPTKGAIATGLICVFYGRVGDVVINRFSASIAVNSYTELFDTAMPRNIVQAQCRHTLFDSGCALTQATFKKTGTVASGSTRSQIVSTITAPLGSATYALGQIIMTSGDNDGQARMVRDWSGGILSLISPFPFDVQIGDTFEAYPGCDKTTATCNLFSNIANWGGFTTVPKPETAV